MSTDWVTDPGFLEVLRTIGGLQSGDELMTCALPRTMASWEGGARDWDSEWEGVVLTLVAPSHRESPSYTTAWEITFCSPTTGVPKKQSWAIQWNHIKGWRRPSST